MALIYWWMPIVWAAVVAVVVATIVLVRRARRNRAPEADRVLVAHSARLTSLPGYRRALGRYRALVLGAVAVVGVLLLTGTALSSRVVSTTVYQPEMRNRDIVLCLDVSGSMTEYDAAIVGVFEDLVKRFDGERISLVLFNASAATHFPLTSDYEYVAGQLDHLVQDFTSPDSTYEYWNGTDLGNGSSLIGDGLGSCVMRFDKLGEERSRSIILATDNYVAGEPILTLPEAGEFAKAKGITVYGINPGDVASKEYLDDLAKQFQQVVEATGGEYYALADTGAVPSIVQQITAEQTKTLKGAKQLVQTDEPLVFVLIGFGALALLMLVGWRLRR
ncbi:vWA domain-containing protein [Plantibacter sp. Mn2098]|uniref:vWA domain-containing protein n=1 Tax=Plantibacter sp. Mn2098 TaxID=3395266 RepID=UPI003BC0CBBB